MLVVDYSRPQVHRFRRSGLLFEVATLPEEEESIEDYFHWYEPVEGDLVFDAGAYCGLSTHALATRVGKTGSVIAFEPDAGSFAILKRNLTRHSLTNVTALPIALSATSGQAAFHQEASLGSVLSRHSSLRGDDEP
jgi:predicted RNA methylase